MFFKFAEELNELFDKEFAGLELTKNEKIQKQYLLDLWENEYNEEQHKLWIASQPV